MRRWLADKDEVEPGRQGLVAQRMARVEIIAEHGDITPPVALGVLADPAFGGSHLAVLLLVAILRRDELGLQGQDAVLSGGDDHRRDHGMSVGDLPISVRGDGTVGAADAVRAVVLRAIDGDEQLPVEGAKRLKMPPFVQGGKDPPEHGKHLLRWHVVEHVADMVIRGDLLHAKHGLGVAEAPGLGHGGLIRKKGRALGEKHRKRRHRHIVHAVPGIGPPSLVREPAHQFPQLADQVVVTQTVRALLKRICQRLCLVVCGLSCFYTKAPRFCPAVYATNFSK